MKKTYAWLVCVVIISTIILSACGNTSVEKTSDAEEPLISMFVEVENTNLWKVVYHRETKVMYAISWGSYNYGTFTVLLNEDGLPMLYEE